MVQGHSTGADIPGSAMAEAVVYDHKFADHPSGDDASSIKHGDLTHRQLRPRHIQLIGIGGTIGTALYVQIGHGLINGGPGSLFLAFTIW
jgi:amino acid transporter